MNGPSALHSTVCTPGLIDGERSLDSSFHISYRNAWDSLFYLNEHTEYLNCLLNCQEIIPRDQGYITVLGNLPLQHSWTIEQHRFYSSLSCSCFTVAYLSLLPPARRLSAAHSTYRCKPVLACKKLLHFLFLDSLLFRSIWWMLSYPIDSF